MLKQIPKSDINLRPFKVYKTFLSTETGLVSDVAINHNSSSSNLTDVELSENGLYHQLKTMYYNGDNALNPFLSFGDFKPRYTPYSDAKQRVINDRTLVLKIPQTKFGEGIKKNSVELVLEGTDSNRVGLFFSPNKDLDLDIAKSLGGQSFDDFLGDPIYEYGYTNYPELDSLRNYYFERVGERNIYEFIRLVKFYDKSLFVNLREMLPARAVVTTGLLIAPHILERSKHKINKPIAESETLEGVVSESQITELDATFDVYDSTLIVNETEQINGDVLSIEVELREDAAYNLEGDVSSFESTIGFNADEISDGEYLTYDDGIIDANLKEPTITSELDLLRSGQVVGMDNFENYGYGTYFSNGYGKYIYEENGSFKSKGIRAFIVTKKRSVISTDFDANGYEFTYVTSSYDKELIVQDLHQSASVIGGDIISAVTASGYLRTHYSVTGDKHLGLQNSFYRGSKNTSYIANGVTSSFTTVDGKAPVETFVSNPTTLRISPQGRSNSEPILEVE